VKYARLIKTNISCFLSYVEFRPKEKEKNDRSVKWEDSLGVEISRRRMVKGDGDEGVHMITALHMHV
jgi:hypothetical protein